MKESDTEVAGFVVPDAYRGHENAGRVIAIGPKCEVPMNANIIFGDYEPEQIFEQNGKKYIFLKDHDAICVVEGDL